MAKSADRRMADLYWRYAGEAMRVAFLITGDKHAAEDITQDAFIRLFSRFQELRKTDAFETYLRRTIVNLSRDRFRRLRSERDYLARQTNHSSQEEGAGLRVEDREFIRRTLQNLPHRQRAALVLRFYLDLSEQQTGEVLQCSVAAVKSLISRAIDSLGGRTRGEIT